MGFLRQSTQVVKLIGPFLDKGDGVTEEAGLAGAGTEISKEGAAFGAGPTLGTHDSDGWYPITLTTTHTNTVGELKVKVHDAATHLPVWEKYTVLEEAIYDALFAASANAFTGAAGSSKVTGVVLVDLTTTTTTVTNQLTAAQIATGVWQDATAGDFTAASSIGKALYIANIAPGASGGHFISGTNAGTTTVGAFTSSGAFTVNELTCTNNFTLDGFVVVGNASVGGGLTVVGTTSLAAVTTSGTVTLNALTVSGAVAFGSTWTITGAVNWNAGATFTGTGNASGLRLSGAGTGNGLRCIGGSTDGAGINAAGTAAGAGFIITAGITGKGISVNGGSTSGAALYLNTASLADYSIHVDQGDVMIESNMEIRDGLAIKRISGGDRSSLSIYSSPNATTAPSLLIQNTVSGLPGIGFELTGTAYGFAYQSPGTGRLFEPDTIGSGEISAGAVDEIWDEVIDGSLTGRQSLRLINSACHGKASGLATSTAVYRDAADSKDRITATVDADGNRTAVTRDAT